MATAQVILAKIEELERRCPGTHIFRNNLEALCSDEPIVCGEFRLESPSTSGRMATFVVNLAEMGQTMDQWLDAELPRHEPDPERDAAYRVDCPNCGNVQIGHSGYTHQISLPDSRWICPNCASVAEFDDYALEEYWEAHRDD